MPLELDCEVQLDYAIALDIAFQSKRLSQSMKQPLGCNLGLWPHSMDHGAITGMSIGSIVHLILHGKVDGTGLEGKRQG